MRKHLRRPTRDIVYTYFFAGISILDFIFGFFLLGFFIIAPQRMGFWKVVFASVWVSYIPASVLLKYTGFIYPISIAIFDDYFQAKCVLATKVVYYKDIKSIKELQFFSIKEFQLFYHFPTKPSLVVIAKGKDQTVNKFIIPDSFEDFEELKYFLYSKLVRNRQ